MNKINWKLRLKNKVTLTALISDIVAFFYQIAAIFDFVPAVSQNEVMQVAMLILSVLVGLGVIVDPTTTGISDSNRAMGYDTPNGEK